MKIVTTYMYMYYRYINIYYIYEFMHIYMSMPFVR